MDSKLRFIWLNYVVFDCYSLSSNRCSAFSLEAGCCFQHSRQNRKIHNRICRFYLFSRRVVYFRRRPFNTMDIQKKCRSFKQNHEQIILKCPNLPFNVEWWACGDDVNAAPGSACTVLTSRCLRKQLVVSVSEHFQIWRGKKCKLDSKRTKSARVRACAAVSLDAGNCHLVEATFIRH